METLAVVGHPVGHSLSPRMHGAALRATGLDGRVRYVARDVVPAALPALVAEVRTGALLGANVTLPHKSAVLRLVDRLEPDAEAIGAVNTLVREGGLVVGANTDAAGLRLALAEAGVELSGARVLVLGAGGAARAAVVASRGAAAVGVCARRFEAARALATLGAEVVPWAADAMARFRASVVIQATSAPLDPAVGAGLAAVIPWDRLDAVVCDLVYRPRRTAVLAAAECVGLRTVDGVGMLVHQGALSFERWLGVAPPIEVMRAAVTAALERSADGVE